MVLVRTQMTDCQVVMLETQELNRPSRPYSKLDYVGLSRRDEDSRVGKMYAGLEPVMRRPYLASTQVLGQGSKMVRGEGACSVEQQEVVLYYTEYVKGPGLACVEQCSPSDELQPVDACIQRGG